MEIEQRFSYDVFFSPQTLSAALFSCQIAKMGFTYWCNEEKAHILSKQIMKYVHERSCLEDRASCEEQ